MASEAARAALDKEQATRDLTCRGGWCGEGAAVARLASDSFASAAAQPARYISSSRLTPLAGRAWAASLASRAARSSGNLNSSDMVGLPKLAELFQGLDIGSLGARSR